MSRLLEKNLWIVFAAVMVFPLTAQPKQEPMPAAEPKYADTLPEQRVHYEANIDYPLFPEHPQLNAIIADVLSKAYFAELSGMFKTGKDVAEKTEGPLNFETAVKPYQVYEDNEYISFVLSYYTYMGGAHGSTALLPITYSKAEKKALTLKEVLNPVPQNWLTVLSAEARRQLAEQVRTNKFSSNTEWIESGTEPDETMFSVFKLEKDTIRIIFGQYQVASYSEGMPEIVIPRRFFQK